MDYFNLKEVEIKEIIGTPADVDAETESGDIVANYSNHIPICEKVNINQHDEIILINPVAYNGIMFRIGDYIYIVYFKTYDVIKIYNKFYKNRMNAIENTFVNIVSIVHHNNIRFINILREYYDAGNFDYTSKAIIKVVDNIENDQFN